MRRQEWMSASGQLLAVRLSFDDDDDGRENGTAAHEILQTALIANNGEHPDRYAAHKHKLQTRETIGTAEAWVVISGKVSVTIYDNFSNHIDTAVLYPGDVFIAFAGGHGYTVFPGARVVELKNGPYNGREADKEMI